MRCAGETVTVQRCQKINSRTFALLNIFEIEEDCESINLVTVSNVKPPLKIDGERSKHLSNNNKKKINEINFFPKNTKPTLEWENTKTLSIEDEALFIAPKPSISSKGDGKTQKYIQIFI